MMKWKCDVCGSEADASTAMNHMNSLPVGWWERVAPQESPEAEATRKRAARGRGPKGDTFTKEELSDLAEVPMYEVRVHVCSVACTAAWDVRQTERHPPQARGWQGRRAVDECDGIFAKFE